MLNPYYQDEVVTIYHGDCRDILPVLPPSDHVITDPPYSSKTHEGARTESAGVFSKLIDFTHTNHKELREIFAACKALRWFIATIDWRHVPLLEKQPPEGWEFIRHGVWVKPNAAPQFTGDRPGTGWEAVAIFHRVGRKRWNRGGHHAVWIINNVLNCPHQIQMRLHPTQKPASLLHCFVSDFSDTDETILDPFMGSGTTLRAAKDLGRKAIGIEIEERYCEIAAKRMAQGVLELEYTQKC